MTTPRPRYASKADWAAAKAAELRRQADDLSRPEALGDWRQAKMREESARELRREAAKFDRIAARYGMKLAS